MKAPIIECSHCKGTGKCQCDECQMKAFGRRYRSNGHYARCCVCGGAGKVAVRQVTESGEPGYFEE